MTKKEFVKSLADKVGISQRDAQLVTEAFLETVEDALVNDGSVSFVGWGTWKVNKREAREGRNPQTGQPIKIAAKKVIKFKAGAPLEEKINS